MNPRNKEFIESEFLLWKTISNRSIEDNSYRMLVNPGNPQKEGNFFNLVIDKNEVIVDKKDLDYIKKIYQDEGSSPRFITSSKDEEAVIHEHSSYVIYDGDVKNKIFNEQNIITEKTEDLGLFSKIIQKSFCFNDQFIKSFESRMKEVRGVIESNFFISYYESNPVGTCSFFRVRDDQPYYAMNGAILPEYQNKGFFKQTINNSLRLLGENLFFTRTNQPKVKKLLCSLGWQCLEDFYIVSYSHGN